MNEYDEIKYIVRSIIEDAQETKHFEEAEKCLQAYRIIGETIKQHFINDLTGSSYTREFSLCRGKLKIEVGYEPRHS